MVNIDEAPAHLRPALRTLEAFANGGSYEDAPDGVTWADLEAAEKYIAEREGRDG